MKINLFAAILLVVASLPSAAFSQSAASIEQWRKKMVEDDVAGAGVKNERVLDSMRRTPRHEFVPLNVRQKDPRSCYYDMALPIGESQTISPPYIVAFMTEAIDPQPTDKVLEIGTGSGYQAAVLSPLVKDVYTIEIVEKLGKTAAKVLEKLKYANVHPKIGDGYQGWKEHAPFDKIIVTCSPEKVPPKLVEQLKEGGRMVIPVGERYQQTMYLLKKVDGKLEQEALLPTLFVPMTGKAESQRETQPDPANPQFVNGGFEETIGDPAEPRGWYYARQYKLVASDSAPEGKRYIRFSNSEGGRNSQVLQGFAVDGRKIKRLDVSFHVSSKDIRFAAVEGSNPAKYYQPGIIFMFYDENRTPLGVYEWTSQRGTNEWEKRTEPVPVPPRTRECIVRVGLLGATGEICFDGLEIKVGKR
jgi:protein-L-isoaspartate(D-aspartate) O-methyltransferase